MDHTLNVYFRLIKKKKNSFISIEPSKSYFKCFVSTIKEYVASLLLSNDTT